MTDLDVEYVVTQNDEFCASSSDPKDAEHYAVVYGQDGPVERKTAVTFTFDGFLNREVIDKKLALGADLEARLEAAARERDAMREALEEISRANRSATAGHVIDIARLTLNQEQPA